MKRLSILIADRTPEFCALLSSWVREHDITCVHSTAEALSATRLLHFDMVVTATLVEDLVGTDSIRRLKQRQPWARFLAVVDAPSEDRIRWDFNRVIQAGADAAVRRTIGEKQFLLALRACWHDVPPRCEPVIGQTNFTLTRT